MCWYATKHNQSTNQPAEHNFGQLAGTVEYTNCTSVEGLDPPPSNEYPAYDAKHSDGEFPVMLELCGMWTTPSLPSLQGWLWPRVVAPDRALSMG